MADPGALHRSAVKAHPATARVMQQAIHPIHVSKRITRCESHIARNGIGIVMPPKGLVNKIFLPSPAGSLALESFAFLVHSKLAHGPL